MAFTTIENVVGCATRLDEHDLPAYVDDDKLEFTFNANKVLIRRYLRRDKNGPLETPAGMFYRVASHVAENDEGLTETFYRLMSSKRFFPNSPTFTGAGTPLGQLAACFVLPLSDDMGGKESDGIFATLRNAALIQQTGGGNGFSFSDLRPAGSTIRTSGGRATGPVGFLRVYDAAFGEIAQGGSRRGANMCVLDISHPDVEQFIACKSEEGSITNFNISVAITDKFMHALRQNSMWTFINPMDGAEVKRVPARDLFAKIVKYAHRNGEPGVLFIDRANASNPVPHLYKLKATNPCVVGSTAIYTEYGIVQIESLANSGFPSYVALDGRFGEEEVFSPVSSPAFCTGERDVYLLTTKEGYELRATGDHRVMTPNGWRAISDLSGGDKVHILNRKAGFGKKGSLEIGRTLGWLIGDGTLNDSNGAAGLMFFGEKRELAHMFAGYVNDFVGTDRYSVGVQEVVDRDESRIISLRLKEHVESLGVRGKTAVPDDVFVGTEDMQRGFLQGLFSADGTIMVDGRGGGNVRLGSICRSLLIDVQRLLLNFGIACSILDRHNATSKMLPDENGGKKLYQTKRYYELHVSKANMFLFAEEIGFLQSSQSSKLTSLIGSYKRKPWNESFVATVDEVVGVGKEKVYDLSEPLTRSFVANGIVVHNCGEQWLGPYENCCLGSINLAEHVTKDDSGNNMVDWELLRTTVCDATRFLDCVVSANRYVDSVPKLKEAALNARRIGLGIMGLADMLYMIRLPYNDESGRELAAQVMEFVRYHCMLTSIQLAKEKGRFKAFSGSIYDIDDGGEMKWSPPTPLYPYMLDFGRPPIKWGDVVSGIIAHGIRNAAQTTVAPTGTIATVCGCEGYGCEPVFALGYTRHFDDDGQDVELKYISPLFKSEVYNVVQDEDDRSYIIEHVAETGNLIGLRNELPYPIYDAFVVSSQISPEDHVKMQAVIQAFVDNSLSKTCNFPPTATEDDVRRAYVQAWELGCKGLTVYVEGSREKVVLETAATKASKEPVIVAGDLTEKELTVVHDKRPRPDVLSGKTYRKATPLGNAYVTVNSNGDGPSDPFEVFLTVGKAGSEVNAVSEALGRLMSLILRLPSSTPRNVRLAMIADELREIGGSRQLGFGPNRVRSLPDGIAQVLLEHMEVGQKIGGAADEGPAMLASSGHGELCPECGDASLLYLEGCRKCGSCGYSEC